MSSIINSKLGRESQAKYNKPSKRRKARVKLHQTAEQNIARYNATDLTKGKGRKTKETSDETVSGAGSRRSAQYVVSMPSIVSASSRRARDLLEGE